MKFTKNIIFKKFLVVILFIFLCLVSWQLLKRPPTKGDWQEQLSILSTAKFNGDLVTIKNVRNFRYSPTESDMHPGYYDKTYNLSLIKRVWYVTEPFNDYEATAHTFVSFEFKNGDFLSITIEARKTKDQTFDIWKGMIHTYPLVYIAADERDSVLLRANIRKDKVYVYPVRLEKQSNARLLLVDMLNTMNKLTVKPDWYNTLFSNCTSSIAKHIDKINPGRIPELSWQLWLTGSADELALKKGLLDTNLPIEEARNKFFISDISQKIGDISSYSKEIRKFNK